MIIYIAIFFILFFVRQSLVGRPNARVQVYNMVLILLFVFSAFRWEVGCDWTGYKNHWWLVDEFGVQLAFLEEPLWWAIIKILQQFDFSYPWLNFVSSLIFFIGIHALAKLQKDPLGFLIIVFPILIINMPMSGIRQGAAIGLICLAYCAFQNKKINQFLIWVILASTIHISSLIFLSMAPLISGNNLKKSIFGFIILIIPTLAFVILITGYQDAVFARLNAPREEADGAVFRVLLLTITAGFYLLIMRRKWKKILPESSKIATLSSFGMILLLPLVLVSSMIGDRIAYYLIPLQAMIISNISYLPIRLYRPFYSIAPYLLLGFVFVIWTTYSFHFTECYVPYKTWIFGFPPEIRAWDGVN